MKNKENSIEIIKVISGSSSVFGIGAAAIWYAPFTGAAAITYSLAGFGLGLGMIIGACIVIPAIFYAGYRGAAQIVKLAQSYELVKKEKL